MPHKNFLPYLPTRNVLTGDTPIAYLSKPPGQVPCYYCGEDCASSPTDYYNPDPYEYLYVCKRHAPLEIFTCCVYHLYHLPSAAASSKKWFINRIKVVHDKMMLHHNFYSPGHTELRERASETFNGYWRTIMSFPGCTINLSPKRLLSILRLSKVFS